MRTPRAFNDLQTTAGVPHTAIVIELDNARRRTDYKSCSRRSACHRKRYRQPTHISSAAGLREGAHMVTHTLNSPQIIGLLERLFAEAEASEPILKPVAHIGLVPSHHQQDGIPPVLRFAEGHTASVSRETGYLLYMLALHSCAIHP